eukprot:1186335-Prorocentrum_minimum.AAC.1
MFRVLSGGFSARLLTQERANLEKVGNELVEARREREERLKNLVLERCKADCAERCARGGLEGV